MSQATLPYHFTRDGFIRAWEAGAFGDQRVEFVDGEIWPVVIGRWHARTVSRIMRALPGTGGEITCETLSSGDSLPDPDCWVAAADAEPVGKVGSKVAIWRPEDVLLVVEVSDDTVMADLTTKAALYGKAGYQAYWVVTKDVIYEHTEPTKAGYRVRVEYRPGDRIPVKYADTDLAVDDLIAPIST
jgi:Uma2 family endonuclease